MCGVSMASGGGCATASSGPSGLAIARPRISWVRVTEMLELTLLGTAMRAVYWIVHFIMMAPDPALLPPAPTQTQFEIAFPSISKEPMDYEN